MAVVALAVVALAGAGQDGRPTERWRGFNLLGMFIDHGQQPGFEEEDFRMIRDLGFNFVRIPMDYRFWIKDKDWDQIDESKLAPVDQAVAYGKKYGLHVHLCFHRAPGYTVAKPAEPRDLFTDPEALRVCCKHWAYFARRYKGIPSSELSFNLFNEPGDVSDEAYGKVAKALVEAIRAEDPGRFIVADGPRWGCRPARTLFSLGIGQAMRGYSPMLISHYKASWIGPMTGEPVWPPPQAVSPLYGPGKAPLNVPLVIEEVPAGTLTFCPGMVSGKVRFRVRADDAVVLTCDLEPKDGAPGWTNVTYKSQWKLSQGRCLSELSVALPKGARRLMLDIPAGDWAELSRLTLAAPGGKSATLAFEQSWGSTNGMFRFMGFDVAQPFSNGSGLSDGRAYLKRTIVDAWQPAFDAGVFCMVGEFGAFNQTPHPIVLSWMQDNLKLWKELGLGWALWNFKGSFGVLDSGRNDVSYEDYQGHKLDRKMLDLLLKY